MDPYLYSCCGNGIVVLKASNSDDHNGRLYYCCPLAKGKNFGCEYFVWEDELCLCKCGQGLCHAFKNQKGVTHICPQIGEKNCGFRQFIGTAVLKATSLSTMGTHNTRKRSQEGEKSQSSSNFPDPKRRRLIDPKREDLKMMDSSDWIPHDKALLTLFGNVRHGDDTTLGRSFDITFFKNVAERLTGSEGTDIDDKDVAWRVRNLRQVFHGNPTGIFTHERMTSDEYGELLRRCFQRDAPPIQVPTCYNTESGGTSRQSTDRGAASCSRYVGQEPDSFTERAADALLHIYNQHSASISQERITLFGRFLNDSRNRILAEMFLKMNHEAQVAYISNMNLDFYAD